ncbi:tyrosine-type recombinase/integrase [Desulfovibrio litoralis]|uniref:Integrase n=1 Tax=Desulfovibrio litoralis DSM 11393 TaxID=1121455 RepID=A0A1M7T7F7_9BACT|nr:tyrosine-type recombinase/integrase [Desulfovibrio litoralis]SHN66653.1 Integrase [Desulfovibrio litoralis DSM 11393]
MALTEKEISSLKPKEKLYRKVDKDNLFIEVPPSGKKRWRFRFRFKGKDQGVSIGIYPEISLKDARLKAHEFKTMLLNGENPADRNKKKASEYTFKDIAVEFFENNAHRVTQNYKEDTFNRIQNHVFPFIGDMPIDTITVHHIIELLKQMERLKILETAKRMRQKIAEIFRYAIVLRLCDHNPAADLQGLIPPPVKKHYATITDEKEIAHLLRAIENYHGYAGTKLALKIAPYIFVRPDELAGAEWSEIDFEKAEWRIPAEKMKMKQTHIVPLARQVVELFQEAREISRSQYCFPSLRSQKRRITPDALRMALRTLGVTKEELTTHGFRAMASTLLNEQGYNRDWIERQLAHGERNSVRSAYNHAEFLNERRKMMQDWADYLDNLRDTLGIGHK